MRRPLTLVCAAKLHDNQLERHLELFQWIPEVARILLVRRAPLSGRLEKVEHHLIDKGPLPLELIRMHEKVRSLCATQTVDWVLAFNPVPWGTTALWAAHRAHVPGCLSLIGMDFLQVQRFWGAPFLRAVKRADAVTVTGNRMRDGLVSLGVRPERLTVLPHSVDLERFRPKDVPRRWDVVAVGQLIRRKRMDVLIDAVARLKQSGTMVRVAILGKGPLKGELLARCAAAQVADRIEFLEYRNDVENVLAAARVFCLASEWEGVPFALMEAMATGLIPVVTRVGTIEDWIEHQKTGYLVDVDDAVGLAQALKRALSPEGDAVREAIISDRERLSLEAGARVWRSILGLDD